MGELGLQLQPATMGAGGRRTGKGEWDRSGWGLPAQQLAHKGVYSFCNDDEMSQEDSSLRSSQSLLAD
jgi:hypothetical protein